jgi:DNA-binding NtrC family response regulator
VAPLPVYVETARVFASVPRRRRRLRSWRALLAKHILVVDDDSNVRDVLVALLEENGFLATPADCGAAMRDILTRPGTAIDAVVLDCMMPGEPGTELALHAKELKLPVIMISGDLDAIHFAAENGLQLLEKPFRSAELVSAIETALSSRQFGQRKA